MKKIVALLFVMACTTTAFSQVTFKPGVRTGVNLASLSNTDTDARVGFYAGIFGELKLGGVYALQPEITYNQQGAKQFELNYLSVRMANKFYFMKDDFPMYIVVAPGFDINLNGKTQSYSNSTSAGVSIESDISLSGGVGYDFPFGLGVEARYKQGVIDAVSTINPQRRLNTVIQVGLSYKFDFSK